MRIVAYTAPLRMASSSLSNKLGISWQDSNWISILNPGNVLDYFSESPFYEKQCNNEIIKMQRLSPDQLNNMVGIEYILLHAQEPILYIIRKQHRYSPGQVTPLADYYMIAGVVYQAPDLCSVINSRLLNTTFRLSSAFEEAMSFVSYHPSKGYSWDFKDKSRDGPDKGDSKDKRKEERSSLFQRQRVDLLLNELSKKYPLIHPPAPQPEPKEEPVKTEAKVEVKTEKTDDKQAMRPPPEKKPKLMR